MYSEDRIKSPIYFDAICWREINPPLFWYKGEPVVTHFFNALSMGIPETERFLVRTLKRFENDIENNELKQKIRQFISEENSHSLQHTKFNYEWKRKLYPVDFSMKFSRFGFKFLEKFFSRKMCLAFTVILEHMTAVIASYGFEKEIMLENESEIFDLFIWHAFEELNHRSLAYDVYQELGLGYFRRLFAVLYITQVFFSGVFILQFRCILTDLWLRRGIKIKHFWYAIKFFLGKGGMLSGSFKNYFSIYKWKFIP